MQSARQRQSATPSKREAKLWSDEELGRRVMEGSGFFGVWLAVCVSFIRCFFANPSPPRPIPVPAKIFTFFQCVVCCFNISCTADVPRDFADPGDYTHLARRATFTQGTLKTWGRFEAWSRMVARWKRRPCYVINEQDKEKLEKEHWTQANGVEIYVLFAKPIVKRFVALNT